MTLQGTLELLIFAGVFPGLLAGITYVVLRPWLLPLGRWRGLAFALYLALFFGRMAFDPHNFEYLYELLVPPLGGDAWLLKSLGGRVLTRVGIKVGIKQLSREPRITLKALCLLAWRGGRAAKVMLGNQRVVNASVCSLLSAANAP